MYKHNPLCIPRGNLNSIIQSKIITDLQSTITTVEKVVNHYREERPMKTRTGFVSNSSSSSFVVLLDNITLEQRSILTTYGFQYDKTYSASTRELAGSQPAKIKDAASLAYSVMCNERDVMAFLVSNNIPFEGCCHYGHYSAFFTEGNTHVTCIRNPGMEAEMYGTDDPLATPDTVFQFISVEKLIKEQKEDDED